VIAISSWTWLVAGALMLLSLGILIRATIGLIGRLKELNRTLSSASEEIGEALEHMRAEMDEASEGLAELRRRREQDAG
jgi:hypothetical protein